MNNKKALFIILSLSFIACILNTSKVTALTETDCLDKIKTKLNAESVDIESIKRMCSEISGQGFLGMMWFDQNSSNNYGNKNATDKTKLELKDEYQQLTAHGFVVFENENLGVKHTYATKIELRTCTNMTKETNDKGHISYNCNGTEETITEGLSNDGHLFNSKAKITPTWTDTEKPAGWPTCSFETQGCPINGWMSRGEHIKGYHFSEGGFENFRINTKIIKDTYFPKSTEKMTIYVYRCMSVQYWTNEPSDGKNVDMAVGACGYDPSTITISNTPDTFLVSSKVQGKKLTEPNYTSWSNQYINSISNGDPTKEDAWNIEFKHILTINGTDHEIKQTSDCRPFGYSCTFSESPNLKPSLKSAGKITGEQSLSVIQNSTGIKKSSEAAKYEVSKTTTQTETGHKDGSIQSGIITFTANCSPRETGVVEIGLNDTSKTISYDLDNQRNTDYSGLPSDVKSRINDNKPNNRLNADPYPGEETKNILPGETKTFTYNGFYEQEITYSYNMRQNTQTTTNTDENGTVNEVTENVGDAYPTNISVSGPSRGSQITCSDTTVYRPTKFYEFDNDENGVENHLKGESHWGPDSTEVNVQATTENTSILGNTGKLYADSNTNDRITLNYKYINNYHFYPNTVPLRLTNLNVVWWKNESTLPSFTPTIIDNGTREETETIIVENINGEPNTGNNTELTLGTHDKKICRKAKTIHSQLVNYNTTDLNNITNGELSAETCAHLYRPWNYNLSFTSIESTSNKGMLYLNNQTTTVTVNLKNDSNSSNDPNQEGNPSYSPETTFTLYQVTIQDRDLENITNIKDYIRNLESEIENGEIPRERVGSPQTRTFEPKSKNNKVEFRDITFNQAGVGDHICLYVIADRTNSTNDTAGNTHTYYDETHPHNLYSNLTCFTVSGFPTFQVRGGSILTEGDVKAKVVESNGEYFGSWIDYGLITKGEIKRLSSGKAFIGSEYKYGPDENRNKNHPLTIANNAANSDEPEGQSNISASETKKRLKTLYAPGAKTALDNSKFTDNLPYDDEIDISKSASYTTYTSNQFTITTPASDTNAKYRYTYINKPDNDTVIKQGSDLPKGVTHVIYSTGNIVIGNDFTYKDDYTGTNAYSQISDIPQYIIIADGNIYIDQAVKEVHAWLIADGEINTCTGYEKWNYPEDELNALHQQDGGKGYNSATYTKDVCNTALKIYGPLFAENIWLERTGISGVTGVSEIINLTAENYYWALAKAKESNKISTAYIRSLAPRY